MPDASGIISQLQPAIQKAISNFALSAGAEKLEGADLTDTLYNAIMDHVPAMLKPMVPEQTLRNYLASSQDAILQKIKDAQGGATSQG